MALRKGHRNYWMQHPRESLGPPLHSTGQEFLVFPRLYFKIVFGVSRGNTAHTDAQEACKCLHGRFLLVSVCAPHRFPQPVDFLRLCSLRS